MECQKEDPILNLVFFVFLVVNFMGVGLRRIQIDAPVYICVHLGKLHGSRSSTTHRAKCPA